jgi:hypothetical protein
MGVVGVFFGVEVGIVTCELTYVQLAPKITDAKPTSNVNTIFLIAPAPGVTSASELKTRIRLEKENLSRYYYALNYIKVKLIYLVFPLILIIMCLFLLR